MRKNLLKLTFLILVTVSLFSLSQKVLAKDNFICATYFTGVGCSHCANTDPLILRQLQKEYPDLVIIEYEIYQQRENAPLLEKYNSEYHSGLGIPLIIFGKEKYAAGDVPILQKTEKTIKELGQNSCPLLETSTDFENLDLLSLPGKPKIWKNDRILIRTEEEKWIFQWNGESSTKKGEIKPDKNTLKELLISENALVFLEKTEYDVIEPELISLSGSYVIFDNAIELRVEKGGLVSTEEKQKLTLPKILSLSAVDAVNPCALAVLVLMLTVILAYNPGNKRKVLLAGLVFTASIFIMYFLYGLLIVRFFQIIQALTLIRLWLYKILGGVAIILGFFNIMDFIKYKPGRIGTEMPLFLRPKVKKIISQITSPKGAFGVGIFVTLFLLPCTIGPYIICGGILCSFGLLEVFPWLLLYNLIFILPMLVIVGLIYWGLKRVEDVSGWKDKNIKYLHLIAGIIMASLGIAMVLGLV